jgi:glycogen synthase
LLPQFPIPTPARRHKIYEHLNLNAEQVAAYAEHNGRFDILRSVVMVLRNQQQGHGVVAVSPRYAKQIKQKLSVFWQLSSIGRPRCITGILNALDMSNSLASQPELTIDQLVAIKRTAKLQLQERYGLTVGEEFKLVVFVGRITHQKGCDIIAEAAAYFMPRHPKLQLVVVGPIGDATGAAAVTKLAKLAQTYGSRMYCPVDHYVAGEEKSLILRATDYCLVPSR